MTGCSLTKKNNNDAEIQKLQKQMTDIATQLQSLKKEDNSADIQKIQKQMNNISTQLRLLQKEKQQPEEENTTTQKPAQSTKVVQKPARIQEQKPTPTEKKPDCGLYDIKKIPPSYEGANHTYEVWKGARKIHTIGNEVAQTRFACENSTPTFYLHYASGMNNGRKIITIKEDRKEEEFCMWTFDIGGDDDSMVPLGTTYGKNGKTIKEAKGKETIPECEFIKNQ